MALNTIDVGIDDIEKDMQCVFAVDCLDDLVV